MAPHPKAASATPRLDEIEQAQQHILTTQKAILAMLDHLTNKPYGEDEREPLVHVRAGEERWNICLSPGGKLLASILSVVVSAVVIAALGFAWNGAIAMANVSAQLEDIDSRLDRLGTYVAKVEAQLDEKADKQ